MPIQIECECGKKLNVPDNLAGKKVKCPGCQAIIEAPIVVDFEYVQKPFYKHPAVIVIGLLAVIGVSFWVYSSRQSKMREKGEAEALQNIQAMKERHDAVIAAKENIAVAQREPEKRQVATTPKNNPSGMTISTGDDEAEKRRAIEEAQRRGKALADKMGMKLTTWNEIMRFGDLETGQIVFPKYGFSFIPPEYQFALEREKPVPVEPFAVFMAKSGDNLTFMENPAPNISPGAAIENIIEQGDPVSVIMKERDAGNGWRVAGGKREENGDYGIHYIFSNNKTIIVASFVTNADKIKSDPSIIPAARKAMDSIRFGPTLK